MSTLLTPLLLPALPFLYIGLKSLPPILPLAIIAIRLWLIAPRARPRSALAPLVAPPVQCARISTLPPHGAMENTLSGITGISQTKEPPPAVGNDDRDLLRLCASFQALRISPASCVPVPANGTAPRARHKKKVVRWREGGDEVRLVENWIVHGFHTHAPVTGHVRWDLQNQIFDVERWIVPCGVSQLHFPRTKWVGGDSERGLEEDSDGDIGMGGLD